jgi:hypothetical protein
MLILNNIPVLVSNGSSTYLKVVNAWRSAMTGLEGLLSGMPQQTSDGSVLVALSAWHLYPDLIVLSNETKYVSFGDSLFPGEGVVTIGLRSSNPTDEEGIQWSLTLSHLRFYGDPVPVISYEDNSRVTMDTLHLIALGAYLARYRVSAGETMDAVKLIDSWWKASYPPTAETEVDFTHPLGWVKVLASAASDFLSSQREYHDDCLTLVNFGRRRGKNFLGNLEGKSSPSLA